MADPRGIIRQWPPCVLTIEFGSPLGAEKAIVKHETGVKTNNKVIRKKVKQKSGFRKRI